jgi:hypothetical protein
VRDDEKKEPTEVDPMRELEAMGKVAKALEGLDPEALTRVLQWAVARFKVGAPVKSTGSGTSNLGNGENGGTKFDTLAELFAATQPETDADKTLVGGYWAQFGEGQPDFGAQEINKALKDLGEGVGNITTAFDTLKARKPAPVMQLKKSGSTRQARKTYKLTVAGKAAVEMMIGQQQH